MQNRNIPVAFSLERSKRDTIAVPLLCGVLFCPFNAILTDAFFYAHSGGLRIVAGHNGGRTPVLDQKRYVAFSPCAQYALMHSVCCVICLCICASADLWLAAASALIAFLHLYCRVLCAYVIT